MITEITEQSKHSFFITTPGMHVFWFTNISANITFTITHSNAHVFIYGMYDAHNKEHYTLSTTQHHIAPHAQSHVLIKGVFRDETRFYYDGIIRVDTQSHGTISSLASHNLTIGNKTIVRATPQLEVLPANVSCMHAATTTPIDIAQEHYLMSRGLTQTVAHKALIHGFLNAVRRENIAHK